MLRIVVVDAQFSQLAVVVGAPGRRSRVDELELVDSRIGLAVALVVERTKTAVAFYQICRHRSFRMYRAVRDQCQVVVVELIDCKEEH